MIRWLLKAKIPQADPSDQKAVPKRTQGNRSHPKAVKGTPKEGPTATKGRPETPKSAQRESKRHQCKTTDTQKAATGTPEGKPRESHMREPPPAHKKKTAGNGAQREPNRVQRETRAAQERPQRTQTRAMMATGTQNRPKGSLKGAHKTPKGTNHRACAQKKTARKDAHREPTRVRRETRDAQQRPKGLPKSQKGPHRGTQEGPDMKKLMKVSFFPAHIFKKNRFRARVATIQGKQPQKHTPRKQTKTLKKTPRNIRVLRSKVSRSGLELTFWTCDTHDGRISTRKKPGRKPKQRII